MQNVAQLKKLTTNGWSNRETWLAGLWLTNDQANYDLVLEAKRQGDDLGEQAYWLQVQLRDQLESTLEEADLWRDLLDTAFERINWVEVLEHC